MSDKVDLNMSIDGLQIIEETVDTIEISDSDASDVDTFIVVPTIETETVNGKSEPTPTIVANKKDANEKRVSSSDVNSFISDEKLIAPCVDVNGIPLLPAESGDLVKSRFDSDIITSATAVEKIAETPPADDIVSNEGKLSPGAANKGDNGISTSVNIGASMVETGSIDLTSTISPSAEQNSTLLTANTDDGISTSVNIGASMVETSIIDLTMPISPSAEQNSIPLTAKTEEIISTPQIAATFASQESLFSIEQGAVSVSVSSDDTRANSSNNLDETILPASTNDREMISVIAKANNMIPSEKQIEKIISEISNATPINPTFERKIISVTEGAAELESTYVNLEEQTDSTLNNNGVVVESHPSEQTSGISLNLEENMPVLSIKDLNVLPSPTEQETLSISSNENNVITSVSIIEEVPVTVTNAGHNIIKSTSMGTIMEDPTKDKVSPHPLNTKTDGNVQLLPDNINSVMQTSTSTTEDMMHVDENARGQFKILRQFFLTNKSTTALSTTSTDGKVATTNKCVKEKEATSKMNQINNASTQNKPVSSSSCSQKNRIQNSDTSSSKHVQNKGNSSNNNCIDNNVSSHTSRSSRSRKRTISVQNCMSEASNSQRNVSYKRSASKSPPARKSKSRYDQEESQEELFSIIKDRSQHNGTMTWKQYNMLQLAIVKSIKSNPSDIPPNGVDFINCSYYHKYLSITCGDLASKKWLYKTAAKLKGLWFGADFEIVDKSTLSLIRMRVDLPDDGTSDADILKMLKYQNPKLQTDNWRKISKVKSSGEIKHSFGVDSSSFEALRARGFQTPFGLRRVRFQLLD